MNGRWCVRCGKTDPTPYLKKAYKRFLSSVNTDKLVVDVGCGNGRNSKFMLAQGFTNVAPMDMACGDLEGCRAVILGSERFPIDSRSANIILANYILMFLDKVEVTQVMQEIERIAAKGCFLVIELYPAKDSHWRTAEDIAWLNNALRIRLLGAGWEQLQYSKDKAIYIKVGDKCQEEKKNT